METKSDDKTFRYNVRTTWRAARQGVLAADARPDIAVGSPREWNGTGEQWAPEELLVGSVNSCIMLTFLTLAKASGVELVGYASDADGHPARSAARVAVGHDRAHTPVRPNRRLEVVAARHAAAWVDGLEPPERVQVQAPVARGRDVDLDDERLVGRQAPEAERVPGKGEALADPLRGRERVVRPLGTSGPHVVVPVRH